MALENYRITEFQEKTQVDNGDYVLIDSATDGTHKYQLSRIPAQASAEVAAAVAAEETAREAADAAEVTARNAAIGAAISEEVTARNAAIAANVDDTLTISGKAADAKKTGDEITSVKSDLRETSNIAYELLDNLSKNIMPYPYRHTTETVNGITWTDNGDGTITANGTATGNSQFVIHAWTIANGSVPIDPEKTYIVTGCPKDGDLSTYYIGFRAYPEGVTPNYNTGTMYREFGYGVVISGYAYVSLIIDIKSGVTVDNLVFNPELRYVDIDADVTVDVHSVDVVTDEGNEAFYISDSSGNVLAEYKGDHWISRRFFGKTISVLGDSISTFNGFSPSSWNPYYPNASGNVTELGDMWYSIVASMVEGSTLASASWGGSTVCGNSQDSTGKVMTSDVRIEALSKNNTDPDVIFVYGGTNDWGASKEIGSFSFASELPAEGDITVFSDAYGLMLHKVMTRYPNATIFCCTQIARKTSGDTTFPIKNSRGNTLAEYNDKIKDIASMFGVGVVDFNKCGMTIYNLGSYTIDNLHPNAVGQKLMAEEAVRELLR